LTVTEAIRQLGVAQYEVGTVTYTSSGATAANNETVYSQTPSSGSSHPYGTQISLVVYQVATNETEAASATNATEFSVEE
jgi:beta-lactam-binding protein with PASTA domain